MVEFLSIKDIMTPSNKDHCLVMVCLPQKPFSGGTDTYTWGHSTVLHTLYTAGAFGVGALLFHLGQKVLSIITPNEYSKNNSSF